MAPGIESTTILFDTKKWADEKIEGPFKIGFVHLDYNNWLNLEMRENVGETLAYKLSQFNGPLSNRNSSLKSDE
jgi:hypothetical protein